MVDFNYESLEIMLHSPLFYYDVDDMIELMRRYFNDRTKLEPRINGAKKDELIYEIMESFLKINKICIEELGIAPILEEPIKKESIHNLVYNFFEYNMKFNDENSRYMSEKGISVDEQYFTGDMVCYICNECGKSYEFPIEVINDKKERDGHIGIECKLCENVIFPKFIRDKNRKVIMKK